MKMDFEDGKYVTWFGVSGYFALQGVLWCWKRWVERGEVFSGKRRRMVKRVSTDEAVRLSALSPHLEGTSWAERASHLGVELVLHRDGQENRR
jgi:hypothetical protein